jgi:hypothetical protein
LAELAGEQSDVFGKVGIPFTHVAPRAGAGSLVAMI